MISVKYFHSEKGAALVVSLIILAVITLLGIAGMQNSSLELKMVATTKDRSDAFQAAEAALAIVEAKLTSNPPSLKQLSNGCEKEKGCYTQSCIGGLCFKGIYKNGDGKINCQVMDKKIADANFKDSVQEINDKNYYIESVNSTSGANKEKIDVKVLQEFMCFVEKYNAGVAVSSEENSERQSIDALNDNLVPLFRVTAVAQGSANRSTVVLQSTIKVVN